MAEVKASTNRGEDAVELVRKASCSGADASTYSEFVPPSIAPGSPSFFKRLWIRIQILTACSGLCGARGDGLSGPRISGLASGAQRTQTPEDKTSGLASGAQWTQTPEDSESEVSSRIAATKSTWSEVPDRDIHHSISVPNPSELSVWEELKVSAPRFFVDWHGDFLQVGRLIAEGAQAQIFEAKVEGLDVDFVLKVFKLEAGFSLADLKLHWPLSMREDRRRSPDSSVSWSMQDRSSRFVFDDPRVNIDRFRCLIHGATLLSNGRFAFLMRRYWGDLRTLINQKGKGNILCWTFDFIPQNIRVVPPFSFHDSIRIMLQIAWGMEGLHREGVLHRDLKAANILIEDPKHGQIYCDVADYECAMFVQGTGFWRAPEVLQELQKKEENQNGEIWTKKVDVYSFGMTCYEILTGQIPFDGCTKSKWEDIIRGERPPLPNYVCPQLRKLVEACWDAEPFERPSFLDICFQLTHL